MLSILDNKKIAIVHDWLLGISGTERVLKQLHELWPDAPIYTLFRDDDFTNEFLPNADIRVSGVQRKFEKWGRPSPLLPRLPNAIESFDLSDYDVVISSSVAFSKGLIVPPKTLHISYCYSPTRQLWDWTHESQFNRRWGLRTIGLISQHFYRIWDRHASTRVDQYIAISNIVKKRIFKYYKREAKVVYPPVRVASEELRVESNTVNKFDLTTHHSLLPTGSYFLIVSRLYKHKNVDIAVRAFNKLGWELVVIGMGPEYNKLKAIANRNVSIIGYQNDDEVARYMANCLVFVMPQEEDFGIAPIEAMGYGKPVLALKHGGALEYIKEGVNGIFFEDSHEAVLANGARILKEQINDFNPSIIKQSVAHFGEERFKKEFREAVAEKLYESKDK